MELRLASARIGNFENTLGSGGDGPNLHVATSGLAPPGALWTVLRCAGCSNERSAGKVSQSTSAPIMIRCIDSIDGKPIFEFLEVTEIKTVPHVTLALAERPIGTIRREYLDRILFWGTADLEAKLLEFQHYYNAHRTHTSSNGLLPELGLDGSKSPIRIGSYRWQKHCRGCI